jgi:hypothetical protein
MADKKNEHTEDVHEIGSGAFGTIFHGKLKGTDVAIKWITTAALCCHYLKQVNWKVYINSQARGFMVIQMGHRWRRARAGRCLAYLLGTADTEHAPPTLDGAAHR